MPRYITVLELAMATAMLWTVVMPGSAVAQAGGSGVTLEVRIGSTDGDEPYLFDHVTDAIRLSNGEIVVGNQGTGQLRWYSASGRWIRSRGREGSGPGEYRGLRRILWLPGDSVLAEDGITSRLTLYDREGTLVRSWRTASAGALSPSPPIGRLNDGRFVAVAQRSLTPPPGHTRFDAILVRYGDSDTHDTLAVLRGGEGYTVPCGRGVCGIDVPYGLRTIAAASADYVYFGTGEQYAILRIDPRTRRVDTLRREVPAAELTDALRAFFVDSVVGTVPQNRRAMVRSLYADIPVRRTLPFFNHLLTDDQGHLWAARSQAPGASQRAWDQLDASGRFLGSVLLPAGLRVTRIADGYVVGITRDDSGVEFVDVYRLR
ncbi:MAG TPA: hypothetical protein VFG84_10530 [Gemmatimonadaceae bacterium]|nr:hypothetical protein [Gemmatimonadaceae bacterium]